jgi:hypothetical protein
LKQDNFAVEHSFRALGGWVDSTHKKKERTTLNAINLIKKKVIFTLIIIFFVLFSLFFAIFIWKKMKILSFRGDITQYFSLVYIYTYFFFFAYLSDELWLFGLTDKDFDEFLKIWSIHRT